MPESKKLIFLKDTKESLEYTSRSAFSKTTFPKRENPVSHAEFLCSKINECKSHTEALKSEQVAAIHYKDGMYLEFASARNYDLTINSLEDRGNGIRLLNVKKENNITKATVYVPNGKEGVFLNKIQKYAESSSVNGKPKNDKLVSSIENVQLAVLESFWIGKYSDIPDDNTSVWCEVWLRSGEKRESDSFWGRFYENCACLDIEVKSDNIIFPERIVVLVKANKSKLIKLISVCECIAEIRRAPDVATVFEDLSHGEQQELCDNLIQRTAFKNSNAVVCLLDTGLCQEHPLITSYTKPEFIQAVDTSWKVSDEIGHGTAMAGIALYGDFQNAVETSETVEISHELESVKILPDRGENSHLLYGAITKRAVALAEIENPTVQRAICMAVTSDKFNTNDGSPTSWSAAIDSLTSGDEERGHKRLFFISAGNVATSEFSKTDFPTANELYSVENPGQAWNAITVGGYNKNIEITDPEFTGFSPVADVGDLSPYSSTSIMWDKKWPVKPEILLNAGNVATNGTDFSDCPDLSLLSTSNKLHMHLFTTISGTSSATAEAAWMASQLYKEYPDIWPETVRALLIHSANWTEKMKNQFNSDDKKSSGRRNLLRSCGYGIPSLEKAMWCKNNSVNMVIEGELQPFKKEGNSFKMNEMDLHEIPWPTDVLISMEETPVRLRVTLSYFIEPGPGEIGWKDKYRYPSCGLKFDLINNDETIEDFKKRINVKMRGEDKKDNGDGSSGSERWYLGAENRDVGSIHSDFMDLTAVELCNAKHIAVYPIIGWWRERAYLGKYNNRVRYSLVVSLETPSSDVDLYTPIITQIENTVEASIQTS